MPFQIAHVMERRRVFMNQEIAAVWAEGLAWQEEKARIQQVEQAYGFRHGWYFDEMAGKAFQADGGKNVVWAEQPYID